MTADISVTTIRRNRTSMITHKLPTRSCGGEFVDDDEDDEVDEKATYLVKEEERVERDAETAETGRQLQ